MSLKDRGRVGACVIGNPVKHSLSPALFMYLDHHLHRGVDYRLQELSNEDVPQFLSRISQDSRFVGCNVTLPHKGRVIPHLSQTDPEARFLDSVNVIHNTARGLVGYNTDVIGIKKTFSSQGIELKGKDSLVLGSGGAALGLLYVLAQGGVRSISIYNRSNLDPDWTKRWSEKFPSVEWKILREIESHMDFEIICQTTPVGMQGDEGPWNFFDGLKALKPKSESFAFDLIYTPAITPFMRLMRDQGYKTIGGLTMFVEQALATWKIWFGDDCRLERVKPSLENFLRGILWLKGLNHPVALTGFMGSGKSCLGQELSKILNCPLIETDRLIEARSGMSITEMFSRIGEEKFRELEAEVVRESVSGFHVLSLGGGALLREESRSLVKKKTELVSLNLDEDVLIQRLLKDSSRPLLAAERPEEKIERIKTLLHSRRPLYQEASWQLDLEDQTPLESAFSLLEKFGSAL